MQSPEMPLREYVSITITLSLLPFTYFISWHFVSFFQLTDSPPDVISDRRHVFPNDRKRRRQVGGRHEPVAVFGLQEPPLTENGLPAMLDERVFQKCVEQNRHITDFVHADTEPLLAGKESLQLHK